MGFGPCYHMIALILGHNGVRDAKEWLKAYRGEPADLKRVLRGYRSTLDAPAVDFFEEMMGLYPTAKVILQTRDADAWAKSVDESIGTMWHPPHSRALWWTLPNIHSQRQVAIKWWERSERNAKTHETDPGYMESWTNLVKARVPSEKLLVWSVKEGYAPLCKFLNVPMINEPFPHANDRMDLLMKMNALTIVCQLVTAAWVASIGSISYSIYKYNACGTSSTPVLVFGAMSSFVAIFPQLQPSVAMKTLMGPVILLHLFGVYIFPTVIGITALVLNRKKLGF